MDKKNIEDVMALTPMQEGLLYHYLKEPGNEYYFEQLTLVISAEIDLALFKQAWSVVVETNEMLRTRFRWEEVKKPLQMVLKHHSPQIEILEYLQGARVGAWNDETERRNLWLAGIKQADRNKKFDLQRVPFRITLCKLETSRYVMILSNHHILLDGWSNGIILKEFVEAYRQLTEGKDPRPPIKSKHKDYVKWLRDRDRREQKVFWEKYLQGFDTRTGLPGLLNRPGGRRSTINRASKYRRFLPGDMKRKLEAFARQHKVTLASLFYSAWGVVLQRYNNTCDVVYGTTISGRSAKIKGIENMVGLFINTVPLRVFCQPLENTADFLERVHQSLQRRETYETTPLVDIKSYSSLEGSREMFDCIMVIDNYPLDTLLFQKNKKITFQSYSMSEMTNYDLTIGIEIYDEIKIVFNCGNSCAEESAVVRLVDHFTRILQEMTGRPELAVSQLEMMTDEEKQRLVNEFNANRRKTSRLVDKTLQQLVEEQVKQTPDHIALVGKEEGGKGKEESRGRISNAFGVGHLSYGGLNERANRLACLLIEKGVRPGNIVAIMVERSIEMIVGILAILKSGGAYLPIDPTYPEERINYMLADCNAKFLVKKGDILKNSRYDQELFVLDFEHLDFEFVSNFEFRISDLNSSNLAYIIYTSGSTGSPKGVIIEHSSVVNLVLARIRDFHLEKNEKILQFSSICFDASIEQIFIALCSGAALVLIDETTLLEISRFEAFIVKQAVTHINAVPSFLNNIGLKDMFWLKRVVSGGEVCPVPLAKRLAGYGDFYNAYGPTETTITSISMKFEEVDETLPVLPVGKPIDNTVVYIFDRWMNLVPLGAAGELYIGGDGVSRGYLNNPEMTAEKFLFRSDKSYILYRTGDLARWLPDGNIEFSGRIDRQVKIRGLRIELGEIRNRLLEHTRVKETIVIAKKNPRGETVLCAYIVPDHVPEKDMPELVPGLRAYLSRYLPYYMIPSYFVRLEEIPLTPGGKVDGKALPEQQIQLQNQYIAPRDEVEEKLQEIWTGVLETHAPPGIADNFFHLGGHSLKAMVLVSRIHKEFGVTIPLGEIFKTPTIRGLAGCIRGRERGIYASVEPAEKREYYPLSSAQKRLFFLDKFEDSGTAYNMPAVFRIEGKTDKARFESTFNALIARHESLRTSFRLIDDKAAQRIHDEIVIGHWSLVIGEADRREIDRIIKDFVKPFDLSQAPLLRAGLWKLAEQEHLFLFDIHHIISDGTSIEILFDDFIRLYEGEKTPQQRIQYKDFTLWQNRLLETGQIKEQENYWLGVYPYSAAPPLLNLPTDFPRPTVFCFEGDCYEFKVEPETGSRVKDFSSSIGVTIYMTLMAGLNILLHKYTGLEDIVVGSGIMGRSHGDLHHIIGMFVNSLALRNYPHNDKTCLEFLKEVKEIGIHAFENQDVQFEYLVDLLNPPRDPSRNPIFDVLIVVQNFEPSKREMKAPGFIPYPLENKTAKFDFTLLVSEIEDEFSFNIEYCTALFKKATIQRMAVHFLNVLRQIVDKPGIKIAELDILTPGEKQQLLIDFNETTADYPGDKTIHQLFEEQVKRTPDNIAVIEPPQMEYRTYRAYMTYITYREINQKSNQPAHLLRNRGVKPDTIVGLMAERSVEMIIGILGILKAGGAYLPIDSRYPTARKVYMLKDSAVKWLITYVSKEGELDPVSKEMEVIDLRDKHLYTGDGSNPQHINKASDLVYLIYTSGSTGKPKGVMLEHRNLVNLLVWMFRFTDIDPGCILQFSTICFDASFHEIFSAFLRGGRLVLIDREMRTDIPNLFLYIEKNQVKTVFLPMSMLRVIFNEVDYTDAFPGCVNHIQTAGEQVVVSDMFRNYLQKNHIYLHNHYGPSEAHVVTALTLDPTEEIPELPSIGKPVSNTAIYILDKYRHLQPVGVPGELYIGGVQVGRGYSGRTELTAEKFCLRRPGALFEKTAPVREASSKNFLLKGPGKDNYRSYRSYKSYILYRTGDLARWLTDGNIEFLGRIDYQVKIRGFRIEPGEIEYQLLNHSDVKEAVVVSREDEKRDKYLCAYIVPTSPAAFENTSGITGLRRYLSGKLPDYMVPSYFIRVEQIPLTGSGKVDRKALPEPEVKTGDDYAAPRNAIEKKLVKIWSGVLQVDHLTIGIENNFFALGGHSLKAIILAAKIHKTFNVNLKLTEIFKTPTIKNLALTIEAETKEKFTAIKIAEKKKYYRLSSAQKRMYILQQMDESTVYNMSALFRLEGELDKEKLEKVFQQLIQRHESLRTSFQPVGREPMQRIHDEVEFGIEYYDLATGGENYKQIPNHKLQITNKKETGGHHSFIRPFDLSRAPLLRVGIVEIREHQHILMVDMHHIIGDGTSTRILIEEFESLYAGKEPPALAFQYKDYSEWHNREKTKGVLGEQEAYWLSQFTAEIPVPNLPTDYPRPMVRRFDGGTLGFEIGPEETQALRTCALKHGTTLYILLLAIYTIFLSKLSGQEHIIIGAPVAARRHANLHQIMGMFVNTLPLTYYPVPAKTFRAFLEEVTDKTLEAFENQDYPYEELIDRLTGNITRDAGRNPLFDVTFLLQNAGGNIDKVQIPGLVITPVEYPANTSKFDLSLEAIETGETLSFTFEYSTGLFKGETLRRFSDYFKRLVIGVPGNVNLKLSGMEIISERERHRLLYEFNNTKADYPGDKSLHQLFEEQVERTPDNIAAVGPQQIKYRTYMTHMTYISYRELNEKSNRLAYLLYKKGVKPDTIVAIMVGRSIEMIIALLGILKAGGAYLPIDPDYPGERINYMLADSNTKFLVKKGDIHKNSRCDRELFVLDFEHLDFEFVSNFEFRISDLNSSNLAYIIYTSGSTGRPKGVMVEHRNVLRLVKNTNYIEFKEGNRILPTGALEFDASTFEIWGSLLNGLTLYLLKKEKILSPEILKAAVTKFNIATLWMTSPWFNQVSMADIEVFAGLKNLLVGGDVLSPYHIDRAREKYPGLNIIDGYGPTENTTFSTTFRIDKTYNRRGETIPIGKPIANSTAYIFDKYNHLQPVNVPGELWVGGDGVARGYLNNPEMTCEKFDRDLWDYHDYRDENNQKFLRGGFRGGSFFKKRPPWPPEAKSLQNRRFGALASGW